MDDIFVALNITILQPTAIGRQNYFESHFHDVTNTVRDCIDNVRRWSH